MPDFVGGFSVQVATHFCDRHIRDADRTGKLKRLGGHPIPRTPWPLGEVNKPRPQAPPRAWGSPFMVAIRLGYYVGQLPTAPQRWSPRPHVIE